MKNKFTPSINIERDKEHNFNYIPTPNAKRVINDLANLYKDGIHSFNIIGSYGTGKSAFLIALEKELKGEINYFNIKLNSNTDYEFLNIVGEYDSLDKTISKKFNSKKDNALSIIEKKYRKVKKENKGLAIVVDEFGKILEYAAKNNPEKELYAIQTLSEYVNDVGKNILLIVTLHQNFNSYAFNLNEKEKNEWEKVRGRLKEITFNEPVEQLLYLAAEYFKISKEKNELKTKTKTDDRLTKEIKKANNFNFVKHLNNELIRNLYPLDLLSASSLTLALQRYGQNERSLFTFLSSNEHLGIYNYNSEENPYYNLSCVYDYLIHNFYSLLATPYNPDYLKWQAIQNALERAEALFDNGINEISKLLKTIGLLNIFSFKGGNINSNLLEVYGEKALGISNVKDKLDDLQKKKIVRYLNYKDTFVLFEGTDIDIDSALRDAENKVTISQDIAPSIKEYFELNAETSNYAYYKYGAPRFFKYLISSEPTIEEPEGEYDGIINIIINEKMSPDEIIDFTANCKEAIVFGIFENYGPIKEALLEIEKANYVLKEIADDIVAKREIEKLRNYYITKLNEEINKNIFSESNICWFFNGDEYKIVNRREFNNLLNKVIEKVYYKTPIFKNELVNKHKYSGTISSSRKNLFDQLNNYWNFEDLNFPKEKFPPEKTIYLTLLKAKGIHTQGEYGWEFSKPKEESFIALWEECENFLEESKHQFKAINHLVETLSKKPYKLKKGFLDYWLTIWLFIKKEEYALFEENTFKPELTNNILENLLKNPHKFFIKSFGIEGIKLDLFNNYRKLIDKSAEEAPQKESFIETIKPFLIFYKQLPEYTKKTKKLSTNAINVRDAIAKAKDPERIFFNELPEALGYTLTDLGKSKKKIENYIGKLQTSIDELKNSYNELLNRIETFLITEFLISKKQFPDYKYKLQERYNGLKQHRLNSTQTVFLHRINSGLDDRDAWINSIANSLLGKRLESIDDNEEDVLYDKLSNIKQELDNLFEFNDIQINDTKEEGIILNLASTVEGNTKRQLIIEKDDKNVETIANSIEQILNGDNKTNLSALLKVIKKKLKETNGK